MRVCAAIVGLLVGCAPVDFYFGDAGHEGGALDAGAPCEGCAGVSDLYCDVDTAACVQCLSSAHCEAPYDICDPSTHRCVECLVSADCGGGRACEPTTRHCGNKCTSASECSAFPDALHCAQGGICGPCDDSGDCDTGLYCDAASGRCTQCTGDADCGPSRPFCDRTREVCVQCRTGADCATGKVCDPGKAQCVGT